MNPAVSFAVTVIFPSDSTNPFDAWFCRTCHDFGRGGGSCWCCGTNGVERQWVPRFGGGAETVTWEPEAA